MQRCLVLLALCAAAGLLAGPSAVAGLAASLCLAALLPRPTPVLCLASATAAVCALLGGLGRPELVWSVAALTALGAALGPLVRGCAPTFDSYRLRSLLATVALAGAAAGLAAAFQPVAGAAVLTLALVVAVVTALHERANESASRGAPASGELVLGLATALAALVPVWPALGPLGFGATAPTLVATAERALAGLPPAAPGYLAGGALAAAAGALDAQPVWLLQPLAALLAGASAAALWLFVRAVWPGRGAPVIAGAVLALPWTSPVGYALHADLAALLVLIAAPVAATCAWSWRRGKSSGRMSFLAAALAAALIAPPLALGASAVAVWALPRRWPVLASGLVLAAGVLALASGASTVAVSGALGLLAVAAIGGLAYLRPRCPAIRWPRQLWPACSALGLLAFLLAAGLGWRAVSGSAEPPRTSELRLLDQVRRTLALTPLAYLGDATGARWAAALLSDCPCGPIVRATWDAWQRGDGPPDALVPQLDATERGRVLLLGWYEASALVRRAGAHSVPAVGFAGNEVLFGDELALGGWAVPRRAEPGDDVEIAFTALARRAGTYEVRLALRDDEGEALAETALRLSLATGQRQEQRWQLTIPLSAPTAGYRLSVAVAADGLDLPAPTADGRFVAGTLVVARPEDLLPVGAEPPGTPANVTFGEHLELVAFQVPDGLLPPGSTFPVVLFWRAKGPVHEDLPIFLHLVAPDGRLVSQADGYPLAGRLPTSLWQPGAIVRDERRLSVPPDAAGWYELHVGFYRYRTLERLRVPGTPDDAWRLARVEVRR